MSTYYHDRVTADSPVFAGLGVVGSDGSVVGSPGAIGAPTLDTGDSGYQFDGATEYVISGFPGGPNGDGPFSIELWVMPASGAGPQVLIGSDPDVVGTQVDLALSLLGGSDPQISITMAGGGANTALGFIPGPPGTLKTAVWNHVVFTWDGATGVFYLNGMRYSKDALLAWAPLLTGALIIGGMGHVAPTPPDQLSNAGLSNVTFYDYPLSAQQAIGHFAARSGVPAYPDESTFTGDYWKIVSTDNPLAYYRCDETAGALAVDRSGNGHNGAYGSGSHTPNEPGAIYDGDAAVLLAETYGSPWDPTPAGIATPLTSVSFSTQMTLEAWVDVSGTLSDDAVIAASSGATPSEDGPGFRFYVDPAGKLNLFMSAPPTNTVLATSPNALPSGQYNHVVATFDTNQVVLYVNGAPVASADAAFAANGWASNLCWGFNPISGGPDSAMFPGTIDECAIYRYALTPSRIFKHWKAGLGPLPVPPTPTAAGDDRHYWEILVYDKKDQLVDIPKADIDSGSFNDQLNGGSTASTLSFVRDFNNIGAIKYLYRVHARFWNGKIPRPTDPTWNGYYVDIDQEKTRSLGKITLHLEGDQKQLDRGSVYEDVNPLVNGNPPLDAADYIRHLYTVYAPPGYCILSCPATLFPLLPGQYEMMQLGQVIDAVLKTGRDDLGDLIVWRVNCDANLVRTLLVEADQNPNTVSGVKFKHIFMEMCAKYTIRTKYSEIGNVVTIQGGQDYITGLPVVGSFIDEDSVADFGGWEQIISVWSLISADACESYAQSWLDTYANAQATGEIELHAPDYTLRSGVWVQTWEQAATIYQPAVIKQMRIGSARWDLNRSRVKQTISPPAPTPYLDRAVYKLGFTSGNGATNRVNQLPVNSQQNFVRSGGTMSR